RHTPAHKVHGRAPTLTVMGAEGGGARHLTTYGATEVSAPCACAAASTSARARTCFAATSAPASSGEGTPGVAPIAEPGWVEAAGMPSTTTDSSAVPSAATRL